MLHPKLTSEVLFELTAQAETARDAFHEAMAAAEGLMGVERVAETWAGAVVLAAAPLAA